MIVGISLVALVGALTALKAIGVGGAWIDTVIAILVMLEHTSNGNTQAS